MAAKSAGSAHEWRGRALFPRIAPEDRRACATATLCPCYAVGDTYTRAFGLKWWATPLHTAAWFVGVSATWITAAVIMDQCNRIVPPDNQVFPSGLSRQDLFSLLVTNFTTGANGLTTNSQGVAYSSMFATNCTAVAEAYSAFGASIAEDMSASRAYLQCTARLAPALGGVCVITLLVLVYGAWRRTQMRRAFGLPGDGCNDVTKWLFCTTCAVCQEYRTMRMADVQHGRWEASNELADRGATTAPYVQMTTRADGLLAQA